MTSSPPKSQPSSLRLPVRWSQGEHLALVGDTGTGKSTLASSLLREREFVMILRTKPDDVTYGARTVKRARGVLSLAADRYVVSPRYDEQEPEIREALDIAWQQGGWTVYLDELAYLWEQLGIRRPVDRLLTQGRSKHLTAVTGMQRPVRVTRYALSQSTHVLSFAQDGRDATTLAEACTQAFGDAVRKLGRFEFSWFYRPARRVLGPFTLQSLGGKI